MINSEIQKQIDPLHYIDIHNPAHPSYFFETDTYALLVMRFFTFDSGELDGISLPFLIFENHVYSFERQQERFVLLSDTHHSLHTILWKQLTYNEQLIQHYIDQIDALEDSLYTRKISPIFLDVWFDLKKDLTRIERLLERASEALNKYLDYCATKTDFPKEPFQDVFEHINRYERLSNISSIKLDTLYNYYNSLKNDKINSNIYFLTIISGIFLPLNLIVGFFGMNTQNLFFNADPEGTNKVVIILSVLFISIIFLFPLLRFIERFVLSKLLGRFNIYTKIIEEIRKITSSPK
jgi:magnesium transporter